MFVCVHSKAGKSKSKARAGVEARGCPLPGSQATMSLQCPHMAEGEGSSPASLS